ncbi:MAG: hypothetical protein NTW70_02435 [Chloroflexi bacterium]|nr:hypothetical protein [Chloroflexota bacterium]
MANPEHANDRAEARRRNRLAARERAEAEALGITPEAPAATTASAATPEATGGLGLRAALRSSAGRAPIRADLAYLPTLIRTRAFVLPLALVVVTTVIALQPGVLTSNIAQLAVQSILLPPAFVVAFLGGMLTRRSAWLIGGLFGIITYAASAIVGTSGAMASFTEGNPVKGLLDGITTNIGNPGAMLSDIYGVAAAGILAGAFAGWYGRFLRAMSPNQPTERDRRRMEAERRKGKR